LLISEVSTCLRIHSNARKSAKGFETSTIKRCPNFPIDLSKISQFLSRYLQTKIRELFTLEFFSKPQPTGMLYHQAFQNIRMLKPAVVKRFVNLLRKNPCVDRVLNDAPEANIFLILRYRFSKNILYKFLQNTVKKSADAIPA